MKRILLALAFLPALAFAQTPQPWDTNKVDWQAPTTCSDGSPIAVCPISGYRVERSTSATGTFTLAVTTITITSYTFTGVAAGQNCYRVIAVSAGGNSLPSNVACKTNVAPVPSPPTNLTVAQVIAYDVKPDYQRFAFVRGMAVGTATLGAACDESRTVGNGFYAISRPSYVKLTRTPRSTALVAACA